LEEKQKIYSIARAVQAAYQSGDDDEYLEPRVLVDDGGKTVGRFQDGDYVIFYNIRGEREVELCRSLLEEDFARFPVAQNIRLNFVTMIPYDKRLKVKVAFPPEEDVRETLSEVLSKHGLRQVKISESEKAIHVSYFLNGKVREPFPGEERMVIPSPKDVPYFDQKPEMNAAGVTQAVIQKLASPEIDFIFANFANIDVVGHIENERAILKAVETVDFHLGRVLEAACKAGVITLITADHGTAEKWFYPDGSVDTGHTDSPVPFILVGPEEEDRTFWKVRPEGELSDIAPTILQLLGIPKPPVMTGESLLIQGPKGKRRGKRRVLLILLDGWGFRLETHGNLIARAQTPVMDDLQKRYPFTPLKAAGEAVGLPGGTVGNSEVGHLHIGAG
jgi:2,3-bisphosphoglycerate-independent phosphoglycerate mutase